MTTSSSRSIRRFHRQLLHDSGAHISVESLPTPILLPAHTQHVTVFTRQLFATVALKFHPNRNARSQDLIQGPACHKRAARSWSNLYRCMHRFVANSTTAAAAMQSKLRQRQPRGLVTFANAQMRNEDALSPLQCPGGCTCTSATRNGISAHPCCARRTHSPPLHTAICVELNCHSSCAARFAKGHKTQ